MPARREVLRALATSAGAVSLAGCDRAVSGLARFVGARASAEPFAIESGAEVSRERRLLDRAAFGPAPGEVARVREMGIEAWLDEQLAPARIDDTACELRTAFIDAMHLPADLAFELRPEEVERQLVAHTLVCATHSKRQLHERLVAFFSDHFHVAIDESLCKHLEVAHVRDVLRPRVLGPFRELLRAVVLSPAMLVYLDGRDNAVRRAGDAPNENHARELLELHTLGVDGGYTQRDVMEAARCLSGFVVREELAPGTVVFDPARHDDGEKRVLGVRIRAGGGEADLERLLDILIAHPSCARFIATKLARYFVADAPSPALVDRAARAFRKTHGHIGLTVRALLASEELSSAPPRTKRPFDFVVSSLRALDAETSGVGAVQSHLVQMGHAPFRHPTPDGYPHDSTAWTEGLLPRFRFALALATGALDDARVSLDGLARALAPTSKAKRSDADPEENAALFAHLVGRAPRAVEREALSAHGPFDPRTVALALSSPAFMRS